MAVTASSGGISTPAPTADIKANGSDGPVTINYNTSATISWTSSNANSCSVSPGGWSGTSGSQSSGNLTSSQTYTVNCTGSAGNTSDSATVSWTTNINATSQIEYGSSTSYGFTTTCSTTGLTSHSQTMSGLSPSVTYHFRVLARRTPAGSCYQPFSKRLAKSPYYCTLIHPKSPFFF